MQRLLRFIARNSHIFLQPYIMKDPIRLFTLDFDNGKITFGNIGLFYLNSQSA